MSCWLLIVAGQTVITNWILTITSCPSNSLSRSLNLFQPADHQRSLVSGFSWDLQCHTIFFFLTCLIPEILPLLLHALVIPVATISGRCAFIFLGEVQSLPFSVFRTSLGRKISDQFGICCPIKSLCVGGREMRVLDNSYPIGLGDRSERGELRNKKVIQGRAQCLQQMNQCSSCGCLRCWFAKIS